MPAINTSNPAFLRICPSNKDVVVLPLLPVIDTTFALEYLNANSTSEIIGILFALIALSSLVFIGIPGLLITSFTFKSLLILCFPSSHAILFCKNIFLKSLDILFLSETNTS